MDLQRWSGILLILGGAAILLSSFVNAPGLYQTEEIEERLEILEAHRARWLANQVLVIGAAVVFTLGFGLLAFAMKAPGRSWLPLLGAAAVAGGSISGIYFVYLQTIDPRGGYSGVYAIPENLAYWFWLAGQVLFGIAMQQAGLPRWLGYLTAGSALAYGILYFLTGAGFMTPFLLALMGVVIGIAILRQ